MPYYFLIARNGQEIRSSRPYTARDLREFKNQASCYTFIGELTNSVKNVGLACTAKGRKRLGLRDATPAAPAPAAKPTPPPTPAAKPVAGWWPFTKKKAKQLPRDPRRMAQTVMYMPSPSGRMIQVRGAKRRKRRRR